LRYTPDELEKAFKLVDSSNSSTTNMYLYDNSIKMYKYASPYDIINDFFAIRLEYYQKRKDYQIGALVNELNILKEKYRFIHDIVVGDIDLRGQTKASVESILESRQFAKLATTVGKDTSYDYLVQMPIYSMTQDKLDELKAKLDKKQAEYDLLMSRSIDSIWRDELDELSAECDKYYAEYNANLAGAPLTLKASASKSKKK
jgi:DNA topoisomerase-2